MLGSIQVVVAEAEPFEVDHRGGTDQEIQRQVADELAAGHEVRRGVEVRADVEGHRDLLAAGFFERQPLDPTDRRARIAREGRGVQRKVMREIEETQEGFVTVKTERCTVSIALRRSSSIETTRRGDL